MCNFFGQSQTISIVMENNFVYGVHIHNLGIYGRNAWKQNKKFRKSMLVEKIMLVLLYKKVLLKNPK